MHPLEHNVAHQLLKMFCGTHEQSESPFLLTKAQQRLVAESLEKAQQNCPTNFQGSVSGKYVVFVIVVPYRAYTDITFLAAFSSPGNARTVDLIDFLLFAIPTVIAEQLEDSISPRAKDA